MLEGNDVIMKMRAVLFEKPMTWDEVRLTEVSIPKVKPGWVLIKVKAFGLNHSELVLRKNEIRADYIKKPVIPGIECVGEIEDPSDSRFSKGDHVVALMGGMGRSFDGGYCEYALLPEHHVFLVQSKMDWSELAAVPETFYTAYGSVIEGLQLKKEDVLLVRGGTSALGLAAIQLAKTVGCQIIATTRKTERIALLEDIGATYGLLDDEDLLKKIKEIYPDGVTKVLELVGAFNIPKMDKILRRGAIICVTGQLGNRGSEGLEVIKSIPNGCYVTSFHSNYPSQSDLDEIFKRIDQYKIKPVIGRVFSLQEIATAHEYLEMHYVPGKLVVRI